MTMHSAAERAHEGLVALIHEYRRRGRDRLPTEAALSTELGVSRNSLREALARLESDGVVVRRRRVGTLIVGDTLVAPEAGAPLAYPIDEIVSIPDFFARSDQPFHIEWVAVALERAARVDAERLGIAEGDEVYRVRRKYVLDSGPAALGEHVIPKVLRGHGIHIDALTDGVSTFLAEVEHINVDLVDHVVGAVAAGEDLASELQVPLGTPLLVVDARLQGVYREVVDTVSVGRLTFNPARIRVRAQGR